ncbi:MAG: hypothetical protein ACPHHR_01025 [Cycloclasticus sp.]
MGAQNAMLGVTIAISPFLLNNAQIALIPSIYGITMVLILWVYTSLIARFDDKKLAVSKINESNQ